MADKRFAVLIDSDNISAKYIECILDEMTKYGVITYRRIYGDWTSKQTNKWKRELLKNSITPIQQFSNTAWKNSTDSALIIDAMDILYTDNVDGFCIVSSDSDFTRLASRLRESGMNVIGMGEEKTPRSFRAACNVFTTLEVLLNQNDDELDELEEDELVEKPDGEDNNLFDIDKVRGTDLVEKNSGVVDEQLIKNFISTIITENENRGKPTVLAEIGNRLVKKYSDFDVRNYGYSFLSKFLEEMDCFELIKEGKLVSVRLKENSLSRAEIDEYIINCVKTSKRSGIELATLGQHVHRKFNTFDVKDYGYATFAKFINSINKLEMKTNKAKKKIVCMSKFI